MIFAEHFGIFGRHVLIGDLWIGNSKDDIRQHECIEKLTSVNFGNEENLMQQENFYAPKISSEQEELFCLKAPWTVGMGRWVI